MILRNLLPTGLAWRMVADKTLTLFIDGLGVLETAAVAFVNAVYLDLFPSTTRQLDAWEAQFNLPNIGISDADRRIRLAGAWAAVGGQSPAYIQGSLQAAGFDVWVHEAWVPGTEPVHGVGGTPTYRNPLTYLQQTYPGVSPGVNCGEALALCGEPTAVAGDRNDPLGYPLVNKVPESAYVVPSDPAYWPFFLYIGGETFGDLASVDPIRKDEFEALCLQLCPAHLWLGMLVGY